MSRGPAKEATRRQVQILKIIYDFICANAWPPTIREIMGVSGIKSLRGVTTHLDQLVRHGLIERGTSSRQIRITAKGTMVIMGTSQVRKVQLLHFWMLTKPAEFVKL